MYTPQTDHPLLKRRIAINPYLIGGAEIVQRLLWDVRLESWLSRTKLKRLRDTRQGEKAVILCNGPSLNSVDFDLLKGVYCFGLNKIHLLFPRTEFRPSCIVAFNRFIIEQTADFYNQTDIPLFLCNAALHYVKPAPQRIFYHATGLNRRFARDCSISLFTGYTVTYVALQLAFHMGFAQVALVGCDHNFAAQGPAGKLVHGGQTDPDHFDPSYFAQVPWLLPDLFASEVSYRMAEEIYRTSGRQLVNATDGGKLEILPRMPLQEFLAT